MDQQQLTHHVATTVQRPIDDVAAYLFDPRTMPQWSAILTAAEYPDAVSLLRRGRRLRANLQRSASPSRASSSLDIEEHRARCGYPPSTATA
jgi:hypothetical protein